MMWSELSWVELPQYLSAVNGAAILPVGALEQHGPHLGAGVDAIIADKLCKAVSVRTSVPMLPTLPYGCSLGHSAKWPSTISLQPITLIEVVKQIGDWAYKSGVRRLYIVNAHVTNAAPLRCALEMLRSEYQDMMVAVINTGTMTQRVKEFHFADADDWHANDAETSIIMAIAPELIRSTDFNEADDPDRTDSLVFSHPVNHTSLNGVTGKPSISTLEKGKEWFDWMVNDLVGLIQQGNQETPPIQ